MASSFEDMTTSERDARLQPAATPAVGGDSLDDLFNYDAIDDVFDAPMETTVPATNKTSSRLGGTAALGLDEAIEVTRKARAPKPKLDEQLLVYRIPTTT